MGGFIKLIAVGDISLGDYPFCPGLGIRSALFKGLNPFKNVLPVLAEGDIVFGNLETVLSDYNLNPEDLSSWEMRGTSRDVFVLKETGFNVINIANNHIMQHGKKAFFETVNTLRKYGIEVVGLAEENSKHSKPVIMNLNNYNVGFLGYAFEEDIYGNRKIEYAFGPSCDIEEDIKRLKPKVQMVIVSCHWGLEFMTEPSPNTILLGRNLIEWGADIVLGHHPHVLQGFEYYKNGIIIYSMGNFLFDMIWDEKFKNSAIFIFEIDDKKIQFKMFPAYISNDYSLLLIKEESDQEIKYRCNEINLMMQGDIERKTLYYYLEYEKLRKQNRLKTYKYFLKNILKVKKNFLPQIISRALVDRRVFIKKRSNYNIT